MGDSGDEFERRGRHDKFRRERVEYDNPRQQNRGNEWQNRQQRGGSYQQRGNWYGGNYNASASSRQPYGNEGYRRGGRDYGSSPPHKRSRRDSEEDLPPSKYGRAMDDTEFAAPTHQPHMKSFKQFITSLEDEVDDAEAIAKYQEYKLEFKKTQISEYFLQHKDEEWFQTKYHPDLCEEFKESQRSSLQKRLHAFEKVLPLVNDEELSVDLSREQKLIRLLDSAVIYMEGGDDSDLKTLDMDENEIEATSEEVKKEAKGEQSDDSSSSSSSSDEESESDEEREKKPKKEKKNKKKRNTEKNEEGEIEKKSNGVSPKPLHKTVSLFIKALPPKITRKELEEVLRKTSPGFLRLAFTEAAPERKFYRKAYATFSHDVNIKEICWHLNNQKVQDQELETMVNKSIQLRVRPVTGVTVYKDVLRADLKNAAKLVQKLDNERGLYVDAKEPSAADLTETAPTEEIVKAESEDKSNGESAEPEFTSEEALEHLPQVVEKAQEAQISRPPDLTQSKNPLLENITDYLVEEVSAEEEEMLGLAQNIDTDELPLERDEKLIKVLDRLVLYLRIVHSVDYYCAIEYPGEDDMPSRISMLHARGVVQGNSVKQSEVKEHISSFENKLSKLFAPNTPLSDNEVLRLGKKEENAEIEKFIEANTKDLGDEKYLCPLSGKKFKGPDFVRKHIFNKHAEKLENVKKEVAFFNNYLADPHRPSLPEAPKHTRYDNRDRSDQYANSYRGGGGYASRTGGGGWNQGGYRQNYNNYSSQNYRGGNRQMGGAGNFGGRLGGGFGRDRELRNYKDLDAPDDGDMM